MAGAAETVVSPSAKGTFLIGPMKRSTGLHDDLFARALVLSDGDRQAAIVTIDYLGFDLAYNDLLLASIAQATGIPETHILINCSHNHSAPLTAPWGPWEKKKDKPFHRMLPKALARVVQQAQKAAKPVRVRYRRESVQIGFNRRLLSGDRVVMAPNPHGVVLPWVDVLSFEDPEGCPVAVLFSHAAHPVIVHSTSTLITADYPGFAVRTVSESLGGEAIVMFAQGCCGNINGFPLQGGIDAAAAAGRDLGHAVIRALEGKSDPVDVQRLSVHARRHPLPLQDPPPAAECERLIAKEKNDERRGRLQELLAMAQTGTKPTVDFRMRALSLGDAVCILGLSHEPFAEYHLFAEKVSPFQHTMVCAYTNGLESYVGTEKDYLLDDRGGYETSPWGAAFMMKNRLPLAPEAERRIQAGITRVFEHHTAE